MKIKSLKTALLVMVMFIGMPYYAHAQDSAFQVTIDRNRIPLGTSARLTLEFQGGADPGVLELPKIDGFQVQYLGPSTKVTIINGNYSKSTSHTYSLFSLKIGSFQFPSLKVEIDGQSYVSESINIEVVDSQASSGLNTYSQNQQGSSPPLSLEDGIFLEANLGKKQAYMHERIPLTLKLYVQNLSVSDVSFPEFEKMGFSTDEFAKPRQYEEVKGGLRYEVVEFNTYVYPTRTGEITIGPANLQCSIVSRSQQRSRSPFGGFDSFFDDMFDRVEKHPMTVQSAQVNLNVLPFPEADKPSGFSGGVGEFKFELEASPTDVAVGDPVTIRMFFAGTGNLNAVTLPEFKENESFKVYEPQIKEVDGVKVLEQVLIPKDETITQIPEIIFSYFDTSKGAYQIIKKGPISLNVKPAQNQGELKVFAPEQRKASGVSEKLGHDIVYIKEKPGKFRDTGYTFYASTMLKVWFALITALFLFGLFYYQRHKRVSSDVAYARRLKAPKQARDSLKEAKSLINQEKPKEFYLALFKILQDYFGNKFHLPSQGLTAKELEKVLKEKNVDEQTLSWLKELFDLCDQARFASVQVNAQIMNNSLNGVEKVIDYFERNVS